MGTFSASVEQFDDVYYVQLHGEIDLAKEEEFRAVFHGGTGDFLVDCGDLDFIDCRGLSVMIDASIRYGRIGLWNAPRLLRRMIEITRMEPLFAFESSAAIVAA